MKIPSALSLTLPLLCVALTQCPADAAEKKAAPPPKAEAYAASVPKPTLAGVRYGEHERHVLDFWRAASMAPTPVAFVIHGGGWTGGSKERLDRFVDAGALLQAGISVVAINYRYVSQGKAEGVEPPVKAPLHDAARAIQFVRSKAAEWNIDKTRVAATGGSAGACSSLWLAFHDDLADPKSDDPVARESTRALGLGVGVNAGHDLDLKNLTLFRTLPHLDEVSIGHALISRAIFVGLGRVVKEYLAALDG